MLYELLIISCCTCSVGCVQPCIPFALYPEVGELPEPSPALPYVPSRMEVSRGLRLSEMIFKKIKLGFYSECLLCGSFCNLFVQIFWFSFFISLPKLLIHIGATITERFCKFICDSFVFGVTGSLGLIVQRFSNYKLSSGTQVIEVMCEDGGATGHLIVIYGGRWNCYERLLDSMLC